MQLISREKGLAQIGWRYRQHRGACGQLSGRPSVCEPPKRGRRPWKRARNRTSLQTSGQLDTFLCNKRPTGVGEADETIRLFCSQRQDACTPPSAHLRRLPAIIHGHPAGHHHQYHTMDTPSERRAHAAAAGQIGAHRHAPLVYKSIAAWG